jgi:hypothetical protein
MMAEKVQEVARAVRRRWRQRMCLQGAGSGLLVGGVIAACLGAARLYTSAGISWEAGVLVMAACTILGTAVGLLRRLPPLGAASMVDQRYRLKDHVASAVSFLRSGRSGTVEQLQIAQTESRVAAVDPRSVVPWRFPRALAAAVPIAVLAMVLLVWPQTQVEAHVPVLPAAIAQEAAELAEEIEELEQLAEEEKSEELKELAKELMKNLEEMQDPETDVREALVELSKMQQEVESVQAQFNVAQVDAQLMKLGTAMSVAPALQQAAGALVESEHEKAAEELEKLENPELSRKEAKALSENLAKVAADMQEAGLGELSGAVSEMSDGASGSGGITRGAGKLAKQVRKHARRKTLNSILNAQLRRLAQRKRNLTTENKFCGA